jgi:hypothetical protein
MKHWSTSLLFCLLYICWTYLYLSRYSHCKHFVKASNSLYLNTNLSGLPPCQMQRIYKSFHTYCIDCNVWLLRRDNDPLKFSARIWENSRRWLWEITYETWPNKIWTVQLLIWSSGFYKYFLTITSLNSHKFGQRILGDPDPLRRAYCYCLGFCSSWNLESQT